MTIEYFGMGGRAQPLRAAAFLGGLSYRDRFIDGAQHKATKAAGNRRWSGVPEVTLHDKEGNDVVTIGQSNVCLRLIGSMGGLYPDNVVQRALVDETLAAIEDTMGLLAPSFPVKDAALKKKMRLELMEAPKLPYWFSKFEKRCSENEARGAKNGFIVGDAMTVADLKMHFMLSFLLSGMVDHIDGQSLMKATPKLTAFHEKMKADGDIMKFTAAFKAQTEKYKKEKVAVHVVKGKNVYLAL